MKKRKEFADGHHISHKWEVGVVLQVSDHCKSDMSDSFIYCILVERPVTDSTVLLVQTTTRMYQNYLTSQDKCQEITFY